MTALTVFEDPERRNDHHIVTCGTRGCPWYDSALSAAYYHCPGCGLDVREWPLAALVRASVEAAAGGW